MTDFDYSFLLEVLIGGLLSGVMYSLVAIGFVLIYKTSGVLNFAQGAMVLFSALTFVGILEHGVPFFISLVVTLLIMAVLGVAVEQTVLRPLVNRPPIILFMATLGLAYILEGAAQLIWGAQVHGLNLGFDDKPLAVGDVLISSFDLFAAAVAARWSRCSPPFFASRTRDWRSAPSPTTNLQRSRSACGFR
jgi:branched-chain amino acid transport system permease protein